MSTSRAVLLCLLVLTGLRLAYIGHSELSADEAYYQMWSERLDWGYYSKGPGVAVAIRASTAIFGVNEFGVRFFSPWLALGTCWLLFTFTRRLYGIGPAVWLVLFLNVTPIFMAGSILMTIDPLSIFFWTVAMIACWNALERAQLRWWLLTGASVGLGFLCKYTNAMEVPGIVLALLLVPRWRLEFRRTGFYLMLLIAAIIGSPPVFWNANHAWITLSHLHDRGRLGTSFERPLGEFCQFFLTHLGAYSPLILLGLLAALVWGWQQAGFRQRAADQPKNVQARFLLAFCLPLLAMYTLLAFKTAGEPNWTAPALVSLSVLAAAMWYGLAGRSRLAATACAAALIFGGACSVLVLDTDVVRMTGLPWSYGRDPASRLRGWRTTAEAVEKFRADEERVLGAPVFLIANRYQLAAELHFYMTGEHRDAAGDPPVFLPESQSIENQFSFWPGYDQVTVDRTAIAVNTAPPHNAEEEFRGVGESPFVGHSALYVTDDERLRRVPNSLETGFEECSLVAQYEIRRRGLPLRTLRIYACFNYKGLEL